MRWIEDSVVKGIGQAGALPSLGAMLMGPAIRGFDGLAGTNYSHRWQEFLNKLRIYNSVKGVERSLGLLNSEGVPLRELLARIERLDEFTRGWAYEGIGYYHTRSETNSSSSVQLGSEHIPQEALAMLHAGMGMAHAERALMRIRSNRDDAYLLLNEFTQQCQHSSRREFLGASLEPLGLMAKTYYFDVFDAVTDALNTDRYRRSELRQYFWHGVGRAMYFDLADFLPCCDFSMDRVLALSDSRVDQRNILAGFAWALVLVNLQHPHVIHALFRCENVPAFIEEAIANGIVSSLVIGYLSSPKNDFVTPFCLSFREREMRNSPLHRIIEEPCEIAQEFHRQQEFQQPPDIGKLFRFQPMSELRRSMSLGRT